MASADESYRAWWFLSCKSCHPALAAPVGQIPLGKVRLMKPTAFTAASVIGISANVLWEKAPGQLQRFGFAEPNAHGAPSNTLRRLGFLGLNPLRCLGFGGGTIRREAPIPKRPGHFGTRVKTRNPLRSRAPKRQGGFSAKHQSAQTISTPRSRSLARFSASNRKRASSNPQSKPPRENTELISFFAQAL